MPRVPVIDSPNVAEQPLAAPQAPMPPAGAFGGQVGAAVEGLGEEAGRIATGAYQLAVRQQASEAENAALNKMIKVRSDYVAKFGKDATDAHPQVLTDMEKVYSEAQDSIPSRSGKLLFESNAMRNKRIELSVIETHFATQRKAQRVADYKSTIATGTADLSNLAVTMDKDPLSTSTLKANIGIRLDKLRVAIEQEAEDRGIDPASREAFVRQELAAPVQGLINGLIHSKHPELADAFQQYRDLLKGGAQNTVYRVLNEWEIDQKVRGLMGGMKRYDAGGVGPEHEDEHGAIPTEEVRAALAQIDPKDPNYTAIQKRLDLEVAQDDKLHERAGRELQDRVERAGQKLGKDGSWAVPYGSKDWNDLKRLYPKLADTMETKEAREAMVKTKFQQEQTAYQSRRARGSAIDEISRLPDSAVKELKYADVASMVMAHSPSASGDDINTVWKQVQGWDKRDQISKGMSKIVQAGLKDAFGKNTAAAHDLEPDARAYADDLYEASKERGNKSLNEDDLRKAVTVKAREMAEDHNKWYEFGKNSALKGYKDRPKAKPQEKPDEILNINGHKFNATKNSWVD